MATFSTYAEVLTRDHIQWKAYESGIKKNPPGVPIGTILEHSGGVYENRIDLTDAFRAEARKVAELTSDSELLKIAGLPAVTVSLEHLRHLDPKTRIVCGYELHYTAEESERLGLGHTGPYDPAKTILVSLDPGNDQIVEPD